jgi:hypothetical protein
LSHFRVAAVPLANQLPLTVVVTEDLAAVKCIPEPPADLCLVVLCTVMRVVILLSLVAQAGAVELPP